MACLGFEILGSPPICPTNYAPGVKKFKTPKKFLKVTRVQPPHKFSTVKDARYDLRREGTVIPQ